MSKTKWITSKKYPGVRWFISPTHGRIFYITFTRDGKKIWEKVGSEAEKYSLELAVTVRSNRIKAVRHGEELPQDRKLIPTVQEVYAAYIEWAKGHKRAWIDDQLRYGKYLKPAFGPRHIDRVMPLDLERLKREIMNKRSPATAKHVLGLFRQIFNKGKQWGLVPAGVDNPVKAVKMPVLDNQRERFLSPDEIALLLAELKKRGPQSHDLALLALNLGCRFGELTKLLWSDVNLKASVVTLRGTKTGQTRRLPLNEEARRVIESLQMRGPKDFLFLKKNGARLTQVPEVFATVCDELFNVGLPKDDRRNRATFHTLRHTAASHMAMAGVPLLTIQRILGHTTPTMVSRYAHLAPDAQREAIDVLARQTRPSKDATPIAARGGQDGN